MMPTDAIAPYAAIALLALGFATWLWFKAKWRRDDKAARLAAGIADERRVSLIEPDPTPFEDEPTGEIPLAVDPPVVPAYAEPGVSPGWVMFLGGLVHIACVGPYLRDGTRPCAGCADHFDHVLTGAA